MAKGGNKGDKADAKAKGKGNDAAPAVKSNADAKNEAPAAKVWWYIYTHMLLWQSQWTDVWMCASVFIGQRWQRWKVSYRLLSRCGHCSVSSTSPHCEVWCAPWCGMAWLHIRMWCISSTFKQNSISTVSASSCRYRQHSIFTHPHTNTRAYPCTSCADTSIPDSEQYLAFIYLLVYCGRWRCSHVVVRTARAGPVCYAYAYAVCLCCMLCTALETWHLSNCA